MDQHVRLVRSDSANADFRALIPHLDRELRDNDGDEADYYVQYNQVDDIKYVVIAYYDGDPTGCGALKRYDDATIEVKRMFVSREHRGKGISRAVLSELERWAQDLGYTSLLLETGKTQTAAIGLYLGSGFQIISNYDQYIGVVNSVCMKKDIPSMTRQ